MVTQSIHRAAAAALSEARSTGTPAAPLSTTHSGLTVADAYAIQRIQIDDWAAAGRSIVGYKIGLTSAAMQAQLGVDEPDYGFIGDDMVYPHGAELPSGAFISPKVEPEIAFTLGSDLRGPGLVDADIEAAIDGVFASLEIIDSRIADWKITLVDTIADNASSAALVRGERTLELSEVDVEGLSVALSRNGEAAGSGVGADVLGSPITAVTWLANRLGELGVTLRAGALVLPGSVCAAVTAEPGDTFSADFGPLGTIEVSFAADAQSEEGTR